MAGLCPKVAVLLPRFTCQGQTEPKDALSPRKNEGKDRTHTNRRSRPDFQNRTPTRRGGPPKGRAQDSCFPPNRSCAGFQGKQQPNAKACAP